MVSEGYWVQWRGAGLTMDRKEFFACCPKAELHFHIDCISPDLFLKFSKRNGMDVPFRSREEVKGFFRFRTLGEFLRVVQTSIASIQTETDFAEMVLECARDMKEQNIIYREAMFDYTGCYGRRGIPLKTVMNGFAKGLELAREQYGGADIRFIANLDRTNPADDNCAYLEELAKYRDMLPLIAVGMDMDEKGYPAHGQKKAFHLAKNLGFHLTGHNGEDEGADSVKDALCSLGLERIDHGVRAAEDGELLKRLAESEILLTLCPDSNISLGVYPDWQAYPLRRLLEAGVKVCINSDDPGVLPYNLTENLQKCGEVFRLTEEEAVELVRNPFRYNFAGGEHLEEVDRWIEAWRENREI